MSDSKNVLESFRDVVQDLLVPELKAVKVSLDSDRADAKLIAESLREVIRINTEALREELKLTKDALREEIRLNNEALREELRLNLDNLREEIRFRNESLEQVLRFELERNTLATQKLSEKLDFALDVRERLATIEARMPKQ